MKRWLAFDIGCIECGEDSAVIGVYDTEDEAQTAAAAAAELQAANWTGQHQFVVCDLASDPEP